MKYQVIFTRKQVVDCMIDAENEEVAAQNIVRQVNEGDLIFKTIETEVKVQESCEHE